MSFARYAIYATPRGALGAAGAAWLGWDMHAGQPVPHPDVAGLNLAAITDRPRRYGLHATIKPPMRLAAGQSPDALIAAARTLCAGLAPVDLDRLEVTRMGRFLALCPVGNSTALNALAGTVVRDLDRFRAPPSDAELARRRGARLSPPQEANLQRWGYPHVLDAFRFHITLTGPLEKPDQVKPLVDAHFAPFLDVPFRIDHLTVAGEDAAGAFHAIERLPLTGGVPSGA